MFPGVEVRRTLDLDDDMVLRLNHLPVTNVERTIFDLAALVRTTQLDDLIERAVLDKKTTIDELATLGDRLAPPRSARYGCLPRCNRAARDGVVAALSVLERRALELIRQSWLPEPIPQFRPTWADSMHFDAALPGTEGGLLNGYPAFGTSSRIGFRPIGDVIDWPRRTGGVVLRFTWEDVHQRPDGVLRQIAEVLGRSRKESSSWIGLTDDCPSTQGSCCSIWRTEPWVDGFSMGTPNFGLVLLYMTH